MGKLQTDSLEARFRKYRQLCGSHYNISITKVFEEEKKIRIQSTLLLADWPDSCKHDDKEPKAELLVEKHGIKLVDDTLKKPWKDMPVLVSIAGFCAHAALRRQPCDDCCTQLTVAERDLPLRDHVLIGNMSRGGMQFPQPCVVHAVLCTKIVLEHVTDEQRENLFLAESKPKSVLDSIMMFLFTDKKEPEVCASGHDPGSVLKTVFRPAINTLLKNYAATKNYGIQRSQVQAKQRKLMTLK